MRKLSTLLFVVCSCFFVYLFTRACSDLLQCQSFSLFVANTTPLISSSEHLNWTFVGEVAGVAGRYTPVVVVDDEKIYVYGNYNGTEEFGGLYLRSGSWSQIGESRLVIPNELIFDQSGKTLVRTTGVSRGNSGYFYSVLHIGDDYPSLSGYTPGWATSQDGINWIYHGKFIVDGSPMPYIYSSAASLIVQEEKPEYLDVVNPKNNRFLVLEDALSMGIDRKLILLYSADGLFWKIYRDSSGEIIELLPDDIMTDKMPSFPTSVRTPFGYHLIIADNYPAQYHRHLFSCDAISWRVLEYESPTHPSHDANPKGTNLFYEQSTNKIHALSSGKHLELEASNYRCP